MQFKPEGPLFLLHEVGRTVALPFANSKACNRYPLWKSASLTTNLFSRGIWIYVCCLSKQMDLMQPHFLFTSSWRNCVLWKFCWLQKYGRMYTIRPMLSEKSTRHMCPVKLFFFFMCHATFVFSIWLRGNSDFFLVVPLTVKFLRSRKS